MSWQGKRLGSNGARTFASPDPLVLPALACVYSTDADRRLSDEHSDEHWDDAVRRLLARRRDAS